MNTLDATIEVSEQLQNRIYDTGHLKGNLQMTSALIRALEHLKTEKLIEVFNIDNEELDTSQLSQFENIVLKIEINTGEINNFFETFVDFVAGNKYKCTLSDFYIVDIKYRQGTSKNIQIEKYRINLEIIKFLSDFAEHEKKINGIIQLFFYSAGKAAKLELDYSVDKLPENFNLTSTHKLLTDFNEGNLSEDKKQVFLNELMNLLQATANNYLSLLDNWTTLIDNYRKSYALFIEGFSFEKVKTASNEHFQKLVDKISESIGKAASYIFGVPVAYILLLNGLDFTGEQVGKNTILLIVGTIFFTLIWHVLFKNISESIESIESEITDFKSKINTVVSLKEVTLKLNMLETKDVSRQKSKLKTVKALSIATYLLMIAVCTYIFLDKGIFYL